MVWRNVSHIASNAVSLILEGRKDVVRKVTHNTHADRWLRKGDELCRGRITPMSTDLTEKVRDIYKKSKSSKGDTALILALEMGLMDMVWGFMECAKQTNTNLHTGQKGNRCVQEFLWLYNEQKKTAFDIAITKGHVEVARLLLNNAHRWCLRSLWIRRREALLHLINNDPIFDGFIFDMLKENPTSPTLQIDDKCVERIVLPGLLDKLGNGLHGLNASDNTVLHIISKIGNVDYIDYILKKDPSQIKCRNSDTETPLYVAASAGHVDNLRFMIHFSKQMNEDIESIVTRSMDNHNALHIAIQNHHVEVVFLLIEKIPQLASCTNESKESPLYLAAERGYFGVVELMLKKCEEISFEGPNGKTALHAAAISNSAECLEYLLNGKCDLLNVQDKSGWTPLRHAVYHNSSSATTKLLDADNSIGYRLFKEDGIYTSPIYIAASLGHCETMEVLMDLCPGCTKFIDKEGRNILHVAIENQKTKAIEFIFQDESLTDLINQKDKNGNTPIHMLVASDFEKMEMLMDSRVNLNALNNEKLTPLDMISSQDQRRKLIKAITRGTRCVHDKTSALPPKINMTALNEKQSEEKENQTDKHFVIVDSLVVVAALIATASFAAAFTVPGGLESSDGSKKGTPFLLREPAFQVFIVTNAIAFSYSCCSLLRYIELLLYRNRYDELSLDEQERVDVKVETMYLLTTLALVAMTFAFVAGLYVVLTPSPALAISVGVMTIFLRGIYHIITWETSWALADQIKAKHLLMGVRI